MVVYFFELILTFDRLKANQIYRIYVLDTTEHPSLFLEQLNILQLLMYGLLVVFWLSCCLDRFGAVDLISYNFVI